MVNFRDPSYLLEGSPRQVEAYRALLDSGVLKTLSAFDPVLAGTIPLGIELPSSDLDILCHANNLEMFQASIVSSFEHLDEFRICENIVRQERSVVANFFSHGFEFEIFGQAIPVDKQYGYVHLVTEALLLKIGGPDAYREVRRLKESGLKTEPAFAKHFALEGDPYETLYALGSLSEEALRKKFDPR